MRRGHSERRRLRSIAMPAAHSAQRLSCRRPLAATSLAGASVPRALAARWRGGRVGHEGRASRARLSRFPRRTVGEGRPPVAQALRLAHLVKQFGFCVVVLPSGRFADIDEPRQATLAQGKPFAHDFVERARRSRRHHATPHNTQLTKFESVPRSRCFSVTTLWRRENIRDRGRKAAVHRSGPGFDLDHDLAAALGAK
jgi:hypothetical protein